MKKLFHNWELKLIAAFTAVILWFFVVGIENSVYLIPEPLSVKIENLGKSVSPASPLATVRVYVNAKGGETKGLKKNDYEAYVDLSGLGAGNYNLPVLVTAQNSQFPVLKVDPATVGITLAPVGEKEVTLVAEVNGTPAQGYVVKEVKPGVEKVKVSAANNILEKIETLTVKVELTGTETSDINQSATPEVPFGLDLPLDGIKTDPEQVTVTAVITPVAGRKTVKVTPQLQGTYASAFTAQVITAPSSVNITGEEKYLKNITEIRTEPVDISLLINRTLPLEVNLQLPDGVALAEPGLKTTLLLDTSRNTQTTVFADVKVVKESPAFKAKKIEPSRISVTVSGPAALIREIGEGDIKVNLDLEQMEKPGSITLDPASIIVPEGASILNYEPAKIKITAN